MAEDKDALSLTDDEDEDADEDTNFLPELQGTLSKWTNYIHGWQDRFIVLKDGTLSYYKSENETSFGCRGAISLARATITPHPFDEFRFDVSVNDCLWYLRSQNEDSRLKWIEAIHVHRTESGYGSENSLRRQSSMLSLTSTASLSTASTSSFKRGRGLREKLAEMETFRDILCRQVDTLQSYFDACAVAMASSIHDNVDHDDIDDLDDFDTPRVDEPSAPNSKFHDNHRDINIMKDLSYIKRPVSPLARPVSPLALPATLAPVSPVPDPINEEQSGAIFQQHGAHAIDFKGEAFTFKATTAGILATLGHCIELMGQREDAWRKKVEREVEKRKRVEEAYKKAFATNQKPIVVGGPDIEEGPNCTLNEDEFFDAIDATLDKLERDEERKKKVGNVLSFKPQKITLQNEHILAKEINDCVDEQIKYADMDLRGLEDDNVWFIIAEDGDMKVYKREMMENGMIVDPLKACHTVRGVTGHELCHYFFDPNVRMEWETSIETSDVIEWVSSDTNVTHQLTKRIWPASQRDALFWSHIRHCPSEDEEGPDLWIVVNKSCEHKDNPTNKYLRLELYVALICQTIVIPPSDGETLSRNDITCKLQYSASVNPGGWAPASVLRAVYKREYPRFLKKFTQYVIDKTKDKDILL